MTIDFASRPLMATGCEDCGLSLEAIAQAGRSTFEALAPSPYLYPQIILCSVCQLKPANRNLFLNPTLLDLWRQAQGVA